MKQRKAPIVADKMTYVDTANFVGVSERTLRRWVRKDNIPHYKVGHRVYFNQEDLFDWVESCRRGE